MINSSEFMQRINLALSDLASDSEGLVQVFPGNSCCRSCQLEDIDSMTPRPKQFLFYTRQALMNLHQRASAHIHIYWSSDTASDDEFGPVESLTSDDRVLLDQFYQRLVRRGIRPDCIILPNDQTQAFRIEFHPSSVDDGPHNHVFDGLADTPLAHFSSR